MVREHASWPHEMQPGAASSNPRPNAGNGDCGAIPIPPASPARVQSAEAAGPRQPLQLAAVDRAEGVPVVPVAEDREAGKRNRLPASAREAAGVQIEGCLTSGGIRN